MIETRPYDPVCDPGEDIDDVFGLTKREYFAAKLAPACADMGLNMRRAVDWADELIKELNAKCA